MAWAGTRGKRTLGMGTGGRRSMVGKNRALFRGVEDIVQGRRRGNLALVYLVSAESQRKRVWGLVMHQVGPDIRLKTLEEGSMQEETSLMVGRKEGEPL